MPAGPPPGQSDNNDEDSDDDIPMPDGPPPPKHGDPTGKHGLTLTSLQDELRILSTSFAAPVGDSGQPERSATFTANTRPTSW